MSSALPKHLCFVLPPFEVYSPVRGLALAIITSEVARELEASGVRTTVVSPSSGPDLYDVGEVIATGYEGSAADRSILSRVRGRLVGWDVPGYDRYLAGVRAAVTRADPEVVVLFNDLVTGGVVGSDSRDRRLYTWLENEVATRRRSGLRLLSRIDGLLAVSSYIGDRARLAYGASAPPITLVPNGVDPSVFRPPDAWPPARDVSGPVRTCFVGRIDPNKGPLLAVQAIRRAQKRGRDVTIDVAGPVIAWGQASADVDRYVAEMERAIAEAGGRWVGSVSRTDLPAFYRDHDLAFVPSVSNEPFGLVALEAMASGCAVIASNRGGLPQVCGTAAQLIDPEDPAAFDQALDVLLQDPTQLTDAREAARIHALTKSWSVSADALLRAVSAAR